MILLENYKVSNNDIYICIFGHFHIVFILIMAKMSLSSYSCVHVEKHFLQKNKKGGKEKLQIWLLFLNQFR